MLLTLLFNKKFIKLALIIFFTVFIALFIYKSAISMINTPFNEFDEAHRAESAKRMKQYGFYFVPLTGSSYDRIINFNIPFENDPISHLYFHVERPPLVYNFMVISISAFGSVEWAYRLPSFILGLLIILSYIIFVRLAPKRNFYAFSAGFLVLIVSSDIWLSSQYAQLDTGITLFLFLSLMSLIGFAETKKKSYLIISSISFALGILSKGQPMILMACPMIYLLIIKKINFKNIGSFLLLAFIILLPWLIPISMKFGLANFLSTFVNFAGTTLQTDILHHKAPIFWYIRWWWESFRPGWTLFLSLLLIDFIEKKFDWKKKTLLIYILGNLAILSIPEDKLWWYVLPLIPAIAYYIYLSTLEHIESNKHFLLNLAVIVVVASRPASSGLTNKLAVFYGIANVLLCFLILYKLQISTVGIKIKNQVSSFDWIKIVFLLAVSFSLMTFLLRFPQIIPYHWDIKSVAQYYASLPGKKCLWIYDMPPESALFYSNAGEIYPLTPDTTPYGHCRNYLITPDVFENKKLIYHKTNMGLYSLDP